MFKLFFLLTYLLVACVPHNPGLREELRQEALLDGKASKNMVATAHPLATEVGLKALENGGNAVDAALAASFMLAVVRPHSTGLGGGGFALVFDGKNTRAYDFRERAPMLAGPKMFITPKGESRDYTYKGIRLKKASLNGHLAAGVPGFVAGWLAIHEQHGELSLEELLAPAIKRAEEGFEVYDSLERAIYYRLSTLKAFAASQKIFLPKGKPLKKGELLIQKDLAKTLRAIAKNGQEEFYHGDTAKKIAAEMEEGGLIQLEDLKSYHLKERAPLKGTYKDYKIHIMPPPSAGGVMILQILKILELFAKQKKDLNKIEKLHLTIEAMRRAYISRYKELGDPDFHHVSSAKLLSDQYIKELVASINLLQASSSKDLLEVKNIDLESDSTTHISVVDETGLAVSSTHTLNAWLGSGVVVKDTGILMNNQMDDFTTQPGKSNLYGLVDGKANQVGAKKRMLSSMSPSFVFNKKDELMLVLGSSGGSKISTTCLEVLLNVLDEKLSLKEAVYRARFHHQWLPDELLYEKNAFTTLELTELARRGHQLKESKKQWGSVQAILKTKEGFVGASDPRTEGLAKGF